MRDVVAAALLLALAGCATRERAPEYAPPAPFAFDRPRPETPFVRRWLVAGPFDVAGSAVVAPAFFDEAAAAPRAGDAVAGRFWREARAGPRTLDFFAAGVGGETAAAYAFTYLHASQDADVVLWVGADNGCRLLVDGRVVHDYRTRNWDGPDAYGLAAHLTRGVHRLLARVENCGGDHRLWLRVADPIGAQPTAVRPSLAPDDPQAAANARVTPSSFSLDELMEFLPRDDGRRIAFDSAADLDRMSFSQGYEDVCPMWRETGGPEYGPHPGRHGVMGMHAPSPDVPERAYWKVRMPERAAVLRLVVSPEAHVHRGHADALLRVGLFDGTKLTWVKEKQVGPDKAPSVERWVTIEEPVPFAMRGRDVLVVLEAASGGADPWGYEGVWFDEIAIDDGR